MSDDKKKGDTERIRFHSLGELLDMMEQLVSHPPEKEENDLPEWKAWRQADAEYKKEKQAFNKRWQEIWEKEKNSLRERIEHERRGAFAEWKRAHPEPEMPDTPPPLMKEQEDKQWKVMPNGKICLCGKCQ